MKSSVVFKTNIFILTMFFFYLKKRNQEFYEYIFEVTNSTITKIYMDFSCVTGNSKHIFDIRTCFFERKEDSMDVIYELKKRYLTLSHLLECCKTNVSFEYPLQTL
jgi:hypothetical protein